jgi:cytochrome c oxidase subunit II
VAVCSVGVGLLIGVQSCGDGAWNNVTVPPPSTEEAVTIEVTGRQWEWIIRYPGADKRFGNLSQANRSADNKLGIDLSPQHLPSHDDFLSDTLFLRKDAQINLEIRSQDVVHGVYMPHFRVKMDAVPGMQTRLQFVLDETTAEMQARVNASGATAQRDSLQNPHPIDFELLCNHICGRGHYGMHKVVVVLERAEYAAWYAKASKRTLYARLRNQGNIDRQFPSKIENKTGQVPVDEVGKTAHNRIEMGKVGKSQQHLGDRQGNRPAGLMVAQNQSKKL